MADTIKDLIKAVYIAGVSNGAGKELTQEEIVHRKKALDFNPIMPEALAEIKRIVGEMKDLTENEVDYWEGTVQTGIDEYHTNLMKALEG